MHSWTNIVWNRSEYTLKLQKSTINIIRTTLLNIICEFLNEPLIKIVCDKLKWNMQIDRPTDRPTTFTFTEIEIEIEISQPDWLAAFIWLRIQIKAKPKSIQSIWKLSLAYLCGFACIFSVHFINVQIYYNYNYN